MVLVGKQAGFLSVTSLCVRFRSERLEEPSSVLFEMLILGLMEGDEKAGADLQGLQYHVGKCSSLCL